MEYFDRLHQLLELERQEDLRQYQQKMVLTPLGERRKQGLTWFPVQINHTELGAGENFYVSLERTNHLDEPHSFQVGDPVSMFFQTERKEENPTLQGIVVAVWKNNMRLAFNVDDLPDWIHERGIGIDWMLDDQSYKEMALALKRAADAKEGQLKQLRAILLNQQPASSIGQVPDYFQTETLNDSQNDAVRMILATEQVALVHGPPGTGKTTTLVEAIKWTLQNEKQVLVTAPSNAAVDLLTTKLAQKGLKVLRIGHPARIDDEVMHHSLETQVTYHDDYRFLKKMRKDSEELRKMAKKYKRNFGKDEREQRRLLFDEAYKLKNEAQTLEKYIVDSLLNQAQVITATLVGSVNKYIRNKTFSTVFIDEAAQALEPACWIPITKAQRVVFAGDHCQLPPTVKAYEAEKGGLAETLFEKCMHYPNLPSAMLKVQYRMHEAIMQFSNQTFYHNQLQAADAVRNWKLSQNPEETLLFEPFEWVDTAGCGFDEEVEPEGQSKYNPEEAMLLLKHLNALMEQLYRKQKSLLTDDFRVSIISPYKAQVNFFAETLKTYPNLMDFSSLIRVNSVDSFQGQEFDVVYISLVRSNAEGSIGFLKDTRRMNVAMTRAKKKLVVFGDSATIARHPFYADLQQYAEQTNAYKSAWEWMHI
jgi:superfamily I DNA and/or RNA helicase